MQRNNVENRKELFAEYWLTCAVFLRVICATYLFCSVILRIFMVPEWTFSFHFVDYIIFDAFADAFFLVDLSFKDLKQLKNQSNLSFSGLLAKRSPRAESRLSRARAISVLEGNGNIVNKVVGLVTVVKHDWRWPLLVFSLKVAIGFPMEIPAYFAGVARPILFKINRLFWMLWIPQHLDSLVVLLEKWGVLPDAPHQRFARVVYYMVVACHFFACLDFWCSQQTCNAGGPAWIQKWSLATCTTTGTVFIANVYERYLMAIYWASNTLTTVGYGDIVPTNNLETVVLVVAIYVGMYLQLAGVSVLTLLIIDTDAVRTVFQMRMEAVKKYMLYKHLPDSLQDRITSFFDYRWFLLKGVDERQFLDELPSSLKHQVTNMFVRDLLKGLPALKNQNNALLNSLADIVQSNFYSPNDEIIRPGQIEPGALIVSRGKVEVVDPETDSPVVEQVLLRGDYFADSSLFSNNICLRLLRASNFCEVLVLPSAGFKAVLDRNCSPFEQMDMKKAVQREIRNRENTKSIGREGDSRPNGIQGYRRNFLPDSSFRKNWDIVIFLGLVYYTIAIPLNLSVCFKHYSYESMIYVGWVVDLIFLADLFLRAYHFYYRDGAMLVVDKQMRMEHFKKGHNLFLEALAAIPYDLFAVFDPTLAPLYRLPKALRLHKFDRYLDLVQARIAEKEQAMTVTFRKFVQLYLLLIVILHWLSCIWIMCADVAPLLHLPTSWVVADVANQNTFVKYLTNTQGSEYLRAMYFMIVACTTMGYGDIVPSNTLERSYSVIFCLYGGMMVPAIIGALAGLAQSLDQSAKEFQAKMDALYTWTKKKNLPLEISDRIFNYYNYLWAVQSGVNENDILLNLSKPLQDQVSLHLVRTVMKKIPFFEHCTDDMQKYMVSVVSRIIYLPDDVIIRAGEMGKGFFAIERGSVGVWNSQLSQLHATLHEGNHFGEGCLLHEGTPRSATVIAIGFCTCLLLTKEGFDSVLSVYPEHKDIILQGLTQAYLAQPQKKAKTTWNTKEQIEKGLGFASFEQQVQGVPPAKAIAIIHPDSLFRHVWSFIVLIVVVYNAFAIPIRLAFVAPISFLAVDYCLDGLLLVDMYLRMFRFGYFFEGELYNDVASITKRYRKTHFWNHAITSLPYDLLALVAYASSVSSLEFSLAFCRIPKLLRFMEIIRMVKHVKASLDKINASTFAIEVSQLMIGCILVSHWAACGFFLLARVYNNQSQCDGLSTVQLNTFGVSEVGMCKWYHTWVFAQIRAGYLPPDGGTQFSLYVRSLEWALPTMNVRVIGDVYPANLWETLYVFLWILVGCMVQSIMVGGMTNLIINMDVEGTQFSMRKDMLNKYMKEHNISVELVSRINAYLTYTFKTYGGAYQNEEKYMADLPLSLQQEVCCHFNLKYIKLCPFFDFCSEDLVKALALHLRRRAYSKGDTIVQSGDMGGEMYFIVTGSVSIESQDGQHFVSLSSGSFFGETGLFFKQKRSASVRANEFCDVMELHKKDFDKELHQQAFNVSRMLGTFTALQEMNKRRNAAVEKNLKVAEILSTKLHSILGPEVNMEPSRRVKSVFLPTSKLRVVWAFLRISFIIYFIIAIPFRIAFLLPSEMIPAILGFDFVIDFFFIIDIYLQCYKFPYFENGQVIFDSEKIKQNYARSKLRLEAIASLPLEIFALATGTQSLFIWRLNHMLRVFRIGGYISNVGAVANQMGLTVSAPFAIFMKATCVYLLVNHWYACIWFIIHRYLETHFSWTWAVADGLAHFDPITGKHSIRDVPLYRAYNRAFYFVLNTISSFGTAEMSPRTSLETLWECTVSLTGSPLSGAIIGAMTLYMCSIDTSGINAFKIKIQRLNMYMKNRSFPDALQTQIRAHHNRLWERNRILNDASIIADLPVPLQMELKFEVHCHAIKAVPILDTTQHQTQRRIARYFTTQICLPDMLVYAAGDIGWDLYFIDTGLIKLRLPTDLSVLDAEGRAFFNIAKRKVEVLGTLFRRGNHFGESSLTSQSGVRQETVQATILTELLVISKDNLEDVLSFLPARQRQEMIKNLITINGNVLHTTSSQFGATTKEVISLVDKNWGNPVTNDSFQNQASLAARGLLYPNGCSSYKTYRFEKEATRRTCKLESREILKNMRKFSSCPVQLAMNTAALSSRPVQMAMHTGVRKYSTIKQPSPPPTLNFDEKPESPTWSPRHPSNVLSSGKRNGAKLRVSRIPLRWKKYEKIADSDQPLFQF